MAPNIEPCGIPDKSIWKTPSVSFIVTPCFLYILSVNAQKLLHPLINHLREVLQQLNHEEYNQKQILKNSSHKIFSVSGFFPVFLSLNKTWFEL